MLIKRYSFLLLSIIVFSFCEKTEGQSTYNPLSLYGIGEPDLNEYGYNAGMGGVGIGIRNAEFLNNINPAALTAIDTNTFIYNMAVSSRFSAFKSGTEKENTLNSNIKKIALGFVPLKGWAISAGMQPFSSIGYKILSNQSVEGTNGAHVQVKYSGNGGLNKLFLSNAIKILPGLSVGVNTFCILGSFSSTEQAGGWLIEKSSSANKIFWDFGMQYSNKTHKDIYYTVGAIYGSNYKIVLDNTLKVTDEENNILDEGSSRSQSQTLPKFYGFGASVALNNRLTIASDYLFQQWSSIRSNFSNVHFTDVNKVRIGFEYASTDNVYASFMQKFRYQGGFSVYNSYLKFGQKQNTNYGISLGLGVPIRGSLIAHLSYEYGKAGLSGNTGKIKENYNLVNISFSIKDFWFLKRKYD